MHWSCRYSTLTAVIVVMTTFITGCGESKVTQCNKLADIINKGEPTLNKVANEMQNLGKGKQPSSSSSICLLFPSIQLSKKRMLRSRMKVRMHFEAS